MLSFTTINAGAGNEAEIAALTALSLYLGTSTHDAESYVLTIKDADVKEFYDANRAQFPGKFDDEKAKVLDELVKSKAPEKAIELDKEIADIRNTVKYWIVFQFVLLRQLVDEDGSRS